MNLGEMKKKTRGKNLNLHGLLTGAFENIAHTVKFVSSPLIAEDLYGGLKLGLQAKTCFMVSNHFKAPPLPSTPTPVTGHSLPHTI